METGHGNPQGQGAARNSLAIVGFVALIIIGILATIYAASFIPKLFTSADNSGAAAYLSTITPDQTNVVTTTPTDQTNTGVSAGTLTPTAPTQPTATPEPTNTITKTIYRYITVPGSSTGTTYSVGPSDLTVVITDIGYYRNGGFVSSTKIPDGYQGAVKYSVVNSGTGASGSYRVDIWVNTPNGTDTDSVTGGALGPGASAQGTGTFDSPSRGTATVRLTVTATSGTETNTGNNTASRTINLGGNSDGPIYDGNHDNYDSNGTYCQYGTFYQYGKYYCKGSSSNSDRDYDSNGNYCKYGTYYSNGRYYCDSSSNDNNYGNNWYDSNGNYCINGTYYSNGRYYCESGYDRNNGGNNWYDSNGNYCVLGTYYSNGRYYCKYNNNNNGCWYDQNGYQVCT